MLLFMEREFPRILQLPPQGRPNWFSRDSSELLYLGWGGRQYGAHPIPVARHTGWSYLVILSGHPQLVLADRRVALRAGDLFIIHPDCASGWTDTSSGRAAILSWAWKSAPAASLRVEAGSLLLGHADRGTLRKLRQLHVTCRMEVGASDEFTGAALAALRASLDVEFQRAFHRKRKRPDSRFQLELAWQWMRRNLHVEKPVESLCDYLEMSPASLHRLFVKATKKPPAEHFHRLRMESARALVRTSRMSVKEIAYALGYRHPNDFSRAFANYFKTTPSTWRKSTPRRRAAAQETKGTSAR